MVQVLCYTGRGFDTCWRPGNVAKNMVVGKGDYTTIRFFRGDFA